MNDLKSYRDNEIKWYIVAFLLLLVSVCYPSSLQVVDIDLVAKIEKLLLSSFLAGTVCTLALVLDSFYTANAKENLIFLGITKMPGKTIFTRISSGKVKDIRFEVKHAQEAYREIIEAMPLAGKEKRDYENSRWYRIFLKHEKEPKVAIAHRDYLLCRDLYTTTISLLALTAAGMLFHILQFSWIPLVYLMALLAVTNLAAHVKGHRFVDTVIAVDLAVDFSTSKPSSIES